MKRLNKYNILLVIIVVSFWNTAISVFLSFALFGEEAVSHPDLVGDFSLV